MARLRKRRKLSQAELAKKIHISQSVMSRIERGTTEVSTFIFAQLAEALGSTNNAFYKRVMKLSERVRAAERAVAPQKMSSRDAERKLVEYVVAVSV